jgi:glutamine synthetase adenylyltransferase
MTHPDSEKRLEELIDRVLRDQPPRRAPADLSERVFAAIERRATRAWWQSGFNEWPAFARVAFLVASLAIAAIALEIPTWLLGTVDPELPVSLSRGLALWQAMRTAVSSLAENIPMYWLYGALAAVAALYATFFGVTAAAYRTLYHPR